MKKIKILLLTLLASLVFVSVSVVDTDHFNNSYNNNAQNMSVTGNVTGLRKVGNRYYIDGGNRGGEVTGSHLLDLENKDYSSFSNLKVFYTQTGRTFEIILYEDAGYGKLYKIMTSSNSVTNHFEVVFYFEDDFVTFSTYDQLDVDAEIYFILDGDNLRPAISGQENFVTNVDDTRPVQYFIDHLSAIDDYDGDISDKIKISTDNYTPNISVVGKHSVTVYVVDSSQNRSEFTFFVNVVDLTLPLISGNGAIVEVGYKDTFDIENFRKTLTVSDNYDTLTNADIKVRVDNYTASKNEIGTHRVVYSATDKSGNEGIFDKKIKVIDNVKPVFSGITTYVKPYVENKTIAEILKGVTAHDEIDQNVTSKIKVVSDTYTGKANIVGKYSVTLEVTDNAGNKATLELKIDVIDDKAAGWWITDGVTMNLAPGAELTRSQIVDLLAKSGQVHVLANARITYNVDTYSDNIGTPGLYTLSFNVANQNGSEGNYTYAVNVLDHDDSDVELTPPDLTILDNIKIFLKANAVTIIVISVTILGVYAVFVKVKKEVKKNKRK